MTTKEFPKKLTRSQASPLIMTLHGSSKAQLVIWIYFLKAVVICWESLLNFTEYGLMQYVYIAQWLRRSDGMISVFFLVFLFFLFSFLFSLSLLLIIVIPLCDTGTCSLKKWELLSFVKLAKQSQISVNYFLLIVFLTLNSHFITMVCELTVDSSMAC